MTLIYFYTDFYCQMLTNNKYAKKQEKTQVSQRQYCGNIIYESDSV